MSSSIKRRNPVSILPTQISIKHMGCCATRRLRQSCCRWQRESLCFFVNFAQKFSQASYLCIVITVLAAFLFLYWSKEVFPFFDNVVLDTVLARLDLLLQCRWSFHFGLAFLFYRTTVTSTSHSVRRYRSDDLNGISSGFAVLFSRTKSIHGLRQSNHHLALVVVHLLRSLGICCSCSFSGFFGGWFARENHLTGESYVHVICRLGLDWLEVRDRPS